MNKTDKQLAKQQRQNEVDKLVEALAEALHEFHVLNRKLAANRDWNSESPEAEEYQKAFNNLDKVVTDLSKARANTSRNWNKAFAINQAHGFTNCPLKMCHVMCECHLFNKTDEA